MNQDSRSLEPPDDEVKEGHDHLGRDYVFSVDSKDA
jgi:hypothetical protein